MKAILPEGLERDRGFAEVKADTEAGRADKVVRELQPFSGRHKDVEACSRHSQNNIERMQCDRYRNQGMQVGSGVVGGGGAVGSSGCG